MAPKKTAKPEKDTQATNLQAEKLKALEHALADLDKQFGKGAVMKMGADAIGKDIPVISTGCLTLDAALGVGGIPRGRIVEIYGPESSGKTTVALHGRGPEGRRHRRVRGRGARAGSPVCPETGREH